MFHEWVHTPFQQQLKVDKFDYVFLLVSEEKLFSSDPISAAAAAFHYGIHLRLFAIDLHTSRGKRMHPAHIGWFGDGGVLFPDPDSMYKYRRPRCGDGVKSAASSSVKG